MENNNKNVNSKATVKFNSQDVAKAKNSKKNSKKDSNGKIFKKKEKESLIFLSTILTMAKIVGACIVIGIIVGVGAVFGVAKAYLGTTPELDLVEISSNDLTSYIYDSNGQLITSYAGVENRDYATLDEIPVLLQKAVIATEDSRFYSHKGFDIKGLLNAFLGNMSSSSVSGGSTLTQQLIKNKLLTTEKSYKRKIQEMSLAMQLESVYTKDQILEAYLNSMPLGGTIYGVKAAALDYFGKDLSELTLRECACLAGITQYPYLYNPRTCMYRTNNMDKLNERINLVLRRLYDQEYITLDQYNAALNDDIKVMEKSVSTDLYNYPHFVEYALSDIVNHFLKARGLENNAANRKAIQNELRTSGYHIYLTVDPVMQETVQTTLSEASYPKMKAADAVITSSDGTETIQPQSAACVVDYHTGTIKAIVGSRFAPTSMQTLNRAYQSRMPVGSSIKPVTVYGPAFDKGCGLGSIIANIPVKIPGWGTAKGYPTTSSGQYGPTTIRKGITSSLNIVAARTLMTIVGVENAYNYLVELGVSTEKLNADGVGLALGTSGITVIEMAGCYSAIANGGLYVEPLSFSVIKDSNGNVVLDANEVREIKQVYKPSTSWLLVEALTNAVNSGTGWRAKLKGMTTAGKTGTNHSNRGVFFAGFTPYYVSTIWIGHDLYKSLPSAYGGDTAAPIWKTYMQKIHEGLENKPILDGSASSYGVTKKSVCAVSGMIPGAGCPTVSDYFPKDGGPTEHCNMHGSATLCSITNELYGKYCPESVLVSGSGIIIPEDSPYALLDAGMLHSIFPNVLTGSFTQSSETDPANRICSYHTYEWACAAEAGNLEISNAQSFLSANSSKLDSAQISNLNGYMSAVTKATNGGTPADIINATSALTNYLSNLKTYVEHYTPPTEDPTEAPTTPPPTAEVTPPTEAPTEAPTEGPSPEEP